MSTKLLMIDDDRKLQRLVRDYLEGYEFALHSVYTGADRPPLRAKAAERSVPLRSGRIEVDRARLECRVDGVIVELAGAELQLRHLSGRRLRMS